MTEGDIILAVKSTGMKSRFLIWLSALALLVLIVAQVVFITETYRTRQQQFDAKFGNIVKEGMIAFNDMDYQFSFDSVLFLLDHMAVDFLFADPDTLESTPAGAFHKVLTAYREPADYLREYIRQAGEEPIFSYHVQIKELYLTDLGYQQKVYPDSTRLPPAPEYALLAGTYTFERNFFRVSYDVLIDFKNRSELILNEMWLILAMAVLTLLFIFSVYYLTLRNMMVQKRLSDMKTDFINNMTHELKTPLSTIAVASSSLSDRSIIQQGKKVEELSAMIKKQNRHLSQLIDRILDINIWEKDQVRLERCQVSVEKWIRELTEAFLLEQGKTAPRIDLRFDLSAETHLLDEVHMSTVINNLLSNAVKYGNTPCRIGVDIRSNTKELSITVTDNGPGISKEEQKHLFEKFYRGEISRKKVIKGLGLGLYYVKQIVEAHMGTITVRSNPGKGTVFQIKIPAENESVTR
ncbi:MAG TPA: HAMP domain-containing histidine kinase [Bacteroides sp.]|nr:HAMP domain-containing histidine kinase [Bacteroides sp.]